MTVKEFFTASLRRHYNGWEVYHNPNGPVTGQYVAFRYGIRIGANTESMLISMIDTKCDLYTPGSCHKECCNV